eukprot:g5428.t1
MSLGLGYLVIENFASPEEVAALRKRAIELMTEFSPESVTFFSTTSRNKIDPVYFHKSASNISFFLEEGSVDENGQLTVPQYLSVNKIGHALHDLDEVFIAFSRSEKVASLLRELKYKSPIPVQSMYICKQPKIGGYVVPHEDNWFLYTEPPSVIGLWLAVEDATTENGCLYVQPKSHLKGVDVRMESTGVIERDTIEGKEPEYDLNQFIPLPAKSGTLVLLHGSLAHYSNENQSKFSRHAYTVHYIEGAEGYHWSEKNWLQRSPDLPFKPLY